MEAKEDESLSVETAEAKDPASEFSIASVDAQEYLNVLFPTINNQSSINQPIFYRHHFKIRYTFTSNVKLFS